MAVRRRHQSRGGSTGASPAPRTDGHGAGMAGLGFRPHRPGRAGPRTWGRRGATAGAYACRGCQGESRACSGDYLRPRDAKH